MTENKAPILIIDSGIGGLTLLSQFLKEKHNERYVYFADYKNAPYGSKSVQTLKREALDVFYELEARFNPKVYVLGCNTLTSVCVNNLREAFPNKIIVGTEPAVKTAIEGGGKEILLLATPNTVKYNKTIWYYSQNKNVHIQKPNLKNLAALIENNIKNLEQIRAEFANMLPKKQDTDSIVLGCTHYIYLKEMLKQFYPNVDIYDGNMGVIAQTLNKIKDNYGNKFNLDFYTNDKSRINNLFAAFELLYKKGDK